MPGCGPRRAAANELEKRDGRPPQLPEDTAGFRLGIYVFKDAEIVDFAAPYGVFSVARRFDPELDAFLIADATRPVQAQAGFTVLPNYSFSDRPAMDAFLIPGGFGTRQEMHNRRLHEFIPSLPETTLLTSVCTGSWIYGVMGLLDGVTATNRKEPDRLEAGPAGKVPIDRLAEIAPACHDQPRARRRRRAHRHGGRHRVGDGDGLPPAAPRRLRRGVDRRGGAGDGVRGRLGGLPRRYLVRGRLRIGGARGRKPRNLLQLGEEAAHAHVLVAGEAGVERSRCRLQLVRHERSGQS